jgi:hypothetical protein
MPGAGAVHYINTGSLVYSIKSVVPKERINRSSRRAIPEGLLAETLNIELSMPLTAAFYPIRNVKIGFKLNQSVNCLLHIGAAP